MTEENSPAGKDIQVEDKLENARWMVATAAAASFASLLVVLGGSKPASSVVEWMSLCFVVALPLTGQYLFATGKARELHVVTELMRWLAVIGMVLFGVGFAGLLSRINLWFSLAWLLTIFAMIPVLTHSEKLRARAGATEDQSAT